MPARTNAFQQLVLELERQLAPLGAVVEESAMLPERVSGELREVDILVSLDEGHHRVRIGVECTDTARPASKQWVEAIAKKHEELGINKTVLVSSAGFYEAAKRRAESLFMSVLSVESVGKADWPTEVLRNLRVPVQDRSSEIVKIGCGFLELAPGQTLKGTSDLRGVEAELPSGSRIGLLDVVLQHGNSILEQALDQDTAPDTAVGRLHDDLRLFRGREYLGVVRYLFLRWKHTTRFFAIRLKPVRYRDRTLAVGRCKRRGVEWRVSALVEDSGVVRIRCESSGALKTTCRFGTLPKGLEHLAL